MVAQVDGLYARTRPTKVVSRLVSYAMFEGRPLTTRGRWINPFVRAFLGALSRLPQLGPVRRPVFIIGLGRSGTTVLGTALSMHPEVGFLNEPKLMWHLIRSDEDLIGNYSDGGARVRLGADDADDATATRARRLHGAYLRSVLCSRLVCKYPELVYRVELVRAIFPDARFLLLIRNGWEACRSIDTWSAGHGAQGPSGNEDWWGVDSRKWRLICDQLVADVPLWAPRQGEIVSLVDGAARGAVEWTLAMRAGRDAQTVLGDALLPVRYEDLTSNPASTMGTILDFCELSADRRTIDFATSLLRRPKPAPEVALPPLVLDAFRAEMHAQGYS